MYRTEFTIGIRHLLGFVLTSLLPGGFLLLDSQEAFCASEQIPSPWLEDAALYDLACPDPQYAWAVGDRGIIWHTKDGGTHWQVQSSGVNCALRGVWFINRQEILTNGGVRALRKQAEEQRNLRQLLRTTSGNLSQEALLTEVAKQAGNLDSMAGATLLLELAQQYRTAGQLDRVADTLQLLVQREPQIPLAESALRWLVAYYELTIDSRGWTAERCYGNTHWNPEYA